MTGKTNTYSMLSFRNLESLIIFLKMRLIIKSDLNYSYGWFHPRIPIVNSFKICFRKTISMLSKIRDKIVFFGSLSLFLCTSNQGSLSIFIPALSPFMLSQMLQLKSSQPAISRRPDLLKATLVIPQIMFSCVYSNNS